MIPIVLLGLCGLYFRLRRCCAPPPGVAPADYPQVIMLPQQLNLNYPLAPTGMAPPDPSQHHRVLCIIAQSGPLGLQLAPAPGGVGAEVHSVVPGGPAAATVRPGDRVLTVGGAPALMAPFGEVGALLQRAQQRPLAVEFLRRNGAMAPPPPPPPAAPAHYADDPSPPAFSKEGTFAAPPPPPDPMSHHSVACTITRAGPVGLGLAPAPGGAGMVVDRVAADTCVEPPPLVGDRILSIAAVDVLMAPPNTVITTLQGAPRPAPVVFLRRNAPPLAPGDLHF